MLLRSSSSRAFTTDIISIVKNAVLDVYFFSF